MGKKLGTLQFFFSKDGNGVGRMETFGGKHDDNDDARRIRKIDDH